MCQAREAPMDYDPHGSPPGAGARLALAGRTDPMRVALDDGAEAIRLANHATAHGLVEVVSLASAIGSVATLANMSCNTTS